MRRVWFVLTAAGEAGPYQHLADAKSAAEPFGWPIISRWIENDQIEEETS